VIPYLSNDEASSLADALRSMRHARLWIVDYVSAQASAFRRRRVVRRSMQNAPFKFAPADWFAFFREHGWGVKYIHYYPEEAARHGRPMPLPVPARLLLSVSRLWMSDRRREAFRTFGGYAMLERL
jgi:O-methyltransferase involved in polyketide biosynthesis